MHRRLFIALGILLLAPGIATPSVAQDATPANGDVVLVGPDEEVGRATLAEWNARWWQWAVSFPIEVNPNRDETAGGRCGYGQSGPVLFLPGAFNPELTAAINCVVPMGTYVYVPIGGVECSTVEPPPFFGRDEEELRACAEEMTANFTDLSLTVNSQEIADLEQYQTTTDMFTLTFPENNLFEVPPGIANAVSSTYDVILAPLPEGQHEITVSATLEGDTLAATYVLTVQAPTVIEPAATPAVASPAA